MADGGGDAGGTRLCCQALLDLQGAAGEVEEAEGEVVGAGEEGEGAAEAAGRAEVTTEVAKTWVEGGSVGKASGGGC